MRRQSICHVYHICHISISYKSVEVITYHTNQSQKNLNANQGEPKNEMIIFSYERTCVLTLESLQIYLVWNSVLSSPVSESLQICLVWNSVLSNPVSECSTFSGPSFLC